MAKKILRIFFAGIFLGGMILFTLYWANTQPVWILKNDAGDLTLAQTSPERNVQILNFIKAHGTEISPTYEQSVCTEFVIQVVEHFERLSSEEKKIVRIITDKNLDSLIRTDDPLIKGIQSALTLQNKGDMIENFEDVRPGDFVQFWNSFGGNSYGHCGVVMEIIPNKSLTVYSSHPVTNGFGVQRFLWPEKIFFARLH